MNQYYSNDFGAVQRLARMLTCPINQLTYQLVVSCHASQASICLPDAKH
jgi:hypothetical protein